MWSYAGAMCLVLASFVVLAIARPRSEHKAVLMAMLVVVGALHAVSFANVFGGPLPGAEWDAWSFHQQAVRLAEAGSWPSISIGTKFYEYILTGAYRLFGSNVLVGQSLSVLVGAGTLLVINAIAVGLGVSDGRVRAVIVLVSGLYPPFVYHNALTFREPYELLGLALGVFFVLKAFREPGWQWVAGAVLSFVLMGLFHHVLLGIGVILLCLFVVFLYAPRWRNRRSIVVVAALVAVTGGMGYLGITNIPITTENDYIKKVRQESGLVKAIVRYRESIESRQPRTSYGSDFGESTGTAFAGDVARNYWNYLFRPFVGDLERAADGIPFASAVARMALLAAFLWLALGRGVLNRELAFCLGVYIVVTAVWSLGTTNYGQAFRHHALTDWLLVLLVASAWWLESGRRRAANDVPKKAQ